MRKLVVIMLMVMLVSGIAFAEKGDIEIGLSTEGNADIPLIYGVYGIANRINIEVHLGYSAYEVESVLDSYLFSITGLYNIIDIKKHTLSVGVGAGHTQTSKKSVSGTPKEYPYKVGFDINALIGYNYNFNSGLTIGINLIPSLVFDTYDVRYYSEETLPIQFALGGGFCIGWKF